jgi:hypothetical protein
MAVIPPGIRNDHGRHLFPAVSPARPTQAICGRAEKTDRSLSQPVGITTRSARIFFPDTSQTSRDKVDRLPRTPAGFTTPVLDDCGLRDLLLARPAGLASLSGSCPSGRGFAPRFFQTPSRGEPLRFANPSPPSGWIKDFHLQAVDPARHTNENGPR